jgi:hypothetical protein
MLTEPFGFVWEMYQTALWRNAEFSWILQSTLEKIICFDRIEFVVTLSQIFWKVIQKMLDSYLIKTKVEIRK